MHTSQHTIHPRGRIRRAPVDQTAEILSSLYVRFRFVVGVAVEDGEEPGSTSMIGHRATEPSYSKNGERALSCPPAKSEINSCLENTENEGIF
jgi:hypothetical protein